jgi:hypothetical protein
MASGILLALMLACLALGLTEPAVSAASTAPRALRFQVVKRTASYVIVKRLAVRLRVKRGRSIVRVAGVPRYRVVKRRHAYYLLTRLPSIEVTDFGARADDASDDTVAIQAAIESCGTGGGTVIFPAGTYLVGSPIKLAPGNVAPLTLSGYGATVRLTNPTPRFLVWNRTALHQTFRKFIVEGFSVDAGGLHPASGKWSVLGFDMRSGGLHDSTYLSIEDIIVRDCAVKNVATSPDTAWNACDINMYTSQWKSRESTWDHISDVLVRNCRLEGGQRGVNIWAGGPGPVSVSIDRVYIRDCWHDTMTSWSVYTKSSNYHIGQYGSVGRAEVTGCYGNRSGDVGVEMDQPSEGLVKNCTMENAGWTGYFYVHFTNPIHSAGSLTWQGGHAADRTCANDSYGYVIGSVGLPLGTIRLQDSTYTISAPGTDHRALYVPNSSPAVTLTAFSCDGLTVRNASAVSDGAMVLVRPASGQVAMKNITVNGARIY